MHDPDTSPARPELPARLAPAQLDAAPDAVVRVPGSKSVTNRALVIAALADGQTTLDDILISDDTLHLANALRAIGIGVDVDATERRAIITGGAGRIPAVAADLFVGNSGTTARFLPPMLALGDGTFRLDGVARMRERPVGPTVDALRSLGAGVECAASGGFPLTIHAHGLAGGEVTVAGDASSQFLSGLLLAGPRMRNGLDVHVAGELVSKPYVELTAGVMRAFGAEIRAVSASHWRVEPSGYRARPYRVEPDASAASYFYALAAVTGGRIAVDGLGAGAAQGDIAFVDVLERMGCAVTRTPERIVVSGPRRGELRAVTADFADISDTAPTLAVVAAFATGETRIERIGFIRHKETDRIAAVVSELRRLGVDAEAEPDAIVVRGPATFRPAVVATYDDHRMAMAFSVIGLAAGGVTIDDPACVAKTFPDFFAVVESLRA